MRIGILCMPILNANLRKNIHVDVHYDDIDDAKLQPCKGDPLQAVRLVQ